MNYSPTTLQDRIEALDLLRGFALLGIFIANMLMFHSPYLHVDPYTYFSAPNDASVFKWIAIFVQSSFYPIFAFLFGYGMNMQYEKALKRGQSFDRVMARRLTILMLFGLAHALFVWSGDVLFTYAVLGFSLILFVRLRAKSLATFAILLYTIPVGFLYVVAKLMVKVEPDLLTEGITETQWTRPLDIYANGTFMEIFSLRFEEWLSYGVMSTMIGVVIVLPIIMFGAAMSKWALFERLSQFKMQLVIVGLLALPLGIYLKALPFIKEPTYDLVQLQQTFGGVILAIGYVALFLYFTNFQAFRSFLKPLGSAGRMSLTTYLSQSIIATILFYAYGFGFYGKIDVWTGTMIAIGVFVIQVVFAEVWFKKFSMGPFERLWRSWTYKKINKSK